MDVYRHLSVLCCPVYVQVLRRADPPAQGGSVTLFTLRIIRTNKYQMQLY